VHMSGDWDWDMAAAGTPAFIFIAAAVSYRATRAADDRRATRSARRAASADGESAFVNSGAQEVEVSGAAESTQAEPTQAVADGADVAGEQPAPVALAAAGADAVLVAGGSNELDAAADAHSDPPPAGSGDTADPYAEGADEVDGTVRTHRHRRPRRPRVGWSVRVVASTALLLLAVSWLPPYLAQRVEIAALAESGDGRIEAALVQARRAARLDPLAVSPLLTEASLLQQLGQNRAALAKLEEAARLQPQNYEVWFALGELQQGALGRVKAARASFIRALALNPQDSASRYELERLAH